MNVVRAAVSVSDMARTVSLSRSQFYAYIGTAFPYPLYDLRSRRPFYNADQQRECLSVRATGIGHDSRYYLFNTPRRSSPREAPSKVKRSRQRENGGLAELLEAVRHLGLEATKGQVEAVVAELYPSGLPEIDGEIIRAVFCRIRRLV